MVGSQGPLGNAVVFLSGGDLDIDPQVTVVLITGTPQNVPLNLGNKPFLVGIPKAKSLSSKPYIFSPKPSMNP